MTDWKYKKISWAVMTPGIEGTAQKLRWKGNAKVFLIQRFTTENATNQSQSQTTKSLNYSQFTINSHSHSSEFYCSLSRLKCFKSLQRKKKQTQFSVHRSVHPRATKEEYSFDPINPLKRTLSAVHYLYCVLIYFKMYEKLIK